MPLVRPCAAALAASAFLLAATATFAADPLPPLRIALPDRPAPDARAETLGGVLEAITVHDARHGTSIRYFSLREASGERVALRWLGAGDAVPGATVQVEGRRSANTLFVERSSTLRKPADGFRDAPPANARRYSGTLEILHVDDFERGRCEMHYVLRNAQGAHLRLEMPVVPDVLEQGMALAVDGLATPDGLAVEPAVITIERAADGHLQADAAPADVTGTTKVLVILVKYADTATEPYTREQVTDTVFAGAASVASYFREASHGKHTLTGTVTPWFRASFNRPGSCDYSRVSSEAMTLARNAGYVPADYHKYVYVFPSLPGCGWSGLGGGSSAWINQNASTLVIGHELGHTFGLGHAASLRCSDAGAPAAADGTCTRSEYGDGYDIMGNARPAHLNAAHKARLGYLSSAAIKVHKGGTATYTLSPTESAGGATYAVKVPATSKRTYWLEWRQPVGFDATLGTGVTGGALVHTAQPSEWYCDTCLVDMTPSTTSFGDAALQVGQTFRDAGGTTLAVLSRTATQLAVSVTTAARPTYADVPATHVGYASIETLAWHGIALECGTNPLRYCPDQPITRAEMAAFVERAKRGPDFAFTATGTRFADVPATHWAAKYIEQLYADGITSGCATNPLRFCPDAPVTRAQMAPFLLKGRYSATFNPGTASGSVFGDVPRSHLMAAWIERLYSYQVTLGCVANPRAYCPESPVTRAQMAIFIAKAFSLTAPPL